MTSGTGRGPGMQKLSFLVVWVLARSRKESIDVHDDCSSTSLKDLLVKALAIQIWGLDGLGDVWGLTRERWGSKAGFG